MKQLFSILILSFFICPSVFSQQKSPIKTKAIDVSGFYDSAHHWKDITDSEQVFLPLPNQKRYKPTQIRKIADNILLYQQKNGGWPKNYDMLAILTGKQKKLLSEGKDSLNTTFDNGATHSQVEYLAKAYWITKDERYKSAALRGIKFMLKAQYPNGGWPQFYPDTSGYRKYITFNDNAMIGVMNVLHEIVLSKPYFAYVDEKLHKEVKEAFEKGIDCILKCQIKENGNLTVWCQQHDNVDFRPRSARTFELTSKCGEESTDIVLFLMSLKHPDDTIINSVKSAVKWFKNSSIKGIRLKTIPSTHIVYKYHKSDSDRVVVKDPNALPIWGRFYELGTNRVFFANRDGKPVYKLSEVSRERRTGYAWYTYEPQKVLDEYPNWLSKIKKEKIESE